MGEKIRDINTISIGKTSLMIELNEGYTKSEGRLIHIQNNKFRYLLKLPDFYNLASLILRGWNEFKYIKNQKVSCGKEEDFCVRPLVKNESYDFYRKLTKKLESKGIDYRVLDVQDAMITIIVSEESLDVFSKVISDTKAKEIIHPFGVEKGYTFLYQMKPFRLFLLDGKYIEVYSQLPCASITPKSWIPVDRKIQKRIWDTKVIEKEMAYCDELCCYIYHLCWAIFHNKGFSPFERQYLSVNQPLLESDVSKELFKVVFFNYTDSLIKMLKESAYDDIIPHYYSFIDY